MQHCPAHMDSEIRIDEIDGRPSSCPGIERNWAKERSGRGRSANFLFDGKYSVIVLRRGAAAAVAARGLILRAAKHARNQFAGIQRR